MFEENLTQLGLSKEESQLYLALLDKGAQSATQLAQATSVKRTYVYSVIEGLISKGLVKQEKSGRSTTFIPLSPDTLLDLAETRKLQVEQAKIGLETILPQLKTLYSHAEEKPLVTYFEGTEGIKKVFKDIYRPKDEPVYGCVDLEKSDEAVPGHIIDKLIPLRIENNVKAISFIAESKTAREVQSKDSQSLRESQLLDKDNYPLPAEIDVYEDKIAMLSFEKGKFVGVLIQNQALATSLKSIFKKAFGK